MCCYHILSVVHKNVCGIVIRATSVLFDAGMAELEMYDTKCV